MSNYKKALRECTEGNLRMTQDGMGHQLMCYTKQCFFGKNTWNETTMRNRGALYYNGKQVNHPFVKIFNIDEHESVSSEVISSRLENEQFEVYDKATGHLFILSRFIDEEGEPHQVMHTKGSLLNENNELLHDDVKIFCSKHLDAMKAILENFPNSTWMFEAIVRHDKHTLWEQQSKKYGEDSFVLLGVSIQAPDDSWNELSYNQFSEIGKLLGFPVIERRTDLETATIDDIKLWYNEKDKEGYVIRFLSDDHRVKVKTIDYWQARLKKDLSLENILSIFRKGGEDRMKLKLPEEIYDQTFKVISDDFEMWFLHQYTLVQDIDQNLLVSLNKLHVSNEWKKNVMLSDTLTDKQKKYLVSEASGKSALNSAMNSPNIREEYVEYRLNNTGKLVDDMKSIIDKGM